jgi:hypothetical protein
MKLLGTVEPWLGLTQGDGVAVLLGGAALGVTAIIGIAWVASARAARRFNAAVNAHAEREIDRERRWKRQ